MVSASLIISLVGLLKPKPASTNRFLELFGHVIETALKYVGAAVVALAASYILQLYKISPRTL